VGIQLEQLADNTFCILYTGA